MHSISFSKIQLSHQGQLRDINTLSSFAHSGLVEQTFGYRLIVWKLSNIF